MAPKPQPDLTTATPANRAVSPVPVASALALYLLTLTAPTRGQDTPAPPPDPPPDREPTAVTPLDAAIASDPGNAALYQRRGVLRFFAADAAGAVADFDRYLESHPEDAPHHWQRGIALYYAGRFADATQQFRDHDSVNPRDVENATWLFLCQSRSESLEAARRDLIPYRGDSRVPMEQIHQLFAGDATPEDVVTAATDDANHLCYAHLYLALYHEATGHPDQALEHAHLAATRYHQDHYMGRVAEVHFKLRQPTATPTPPTPPPAPAPPPSEPPPKPAPSPSSTADP